jgi:hypothetical protein
MTLPKTHNPLKKVLIGFCFLIILLEIIDIFRYPFPELYWSVFNRIMVCIYLIRIVTVKKQGMWIFGLIYFIIGTIDIFFYSVEYRIPRIYDSNTAVFDLTYHFKNIFVIFKSHMLRDIGFYIRIIMMLSFPSIVLLFFTNYVRRFYGLQPIFKFKKK